MGRISEGLKDQFRLKCIELAGGKYFSVLGPFVAGMYKVTKEELDIALAECREKKTDRYGREVPKRLMVPKSMPLISFPWLFERELARIATGIEAEDGLEGLGMQPLQLKSDIHPSRKRAAGGATVDMDDYIQQEDGKIIHRGEELDLFRGDIDSEDISGGSDFEDARARHEHSLVMGASGELVLDTEFQPVPLPDHLLSGTGVEDVVPRTVMDGFFDPQQNALEAHESQTRQAPPASPASVQLLVDVEEHRLSDSFADMVLLNRDFSDTLAGEVIEEEVVDLDVGESSLEKLARMMAA
jgi:RNA-dependent RNA polymerase